MLHLFRTQPMRLPFRLRLDLVRCFAPTANRAHGICTPCLEICATNAPEVYRMATLASAVLNNLVLSIYKSKNVNAKNFNLAQYELDFDLRVQFCQFGHVVMSIDLLFVDNTTTHRLFGDGARVDLLLHCAHGQQAIYVTNLFLSQAKYAENVLFWKIQQK